jgi:hypothetical protein
METIFVDIVKNGGPSAIIVCVGYLFLNNKIDTIVRSMDKICALKHGEVDRRLLHMEERWDGVDRRNQEAKS